MTTLENLKLECLQKIKEGESQESVIEFLHLSGMTIMESIKITMSVYNISLGEAKSIVAGHSIWNDVISAANPLHEDISNNIT